MLHGSLPWEHNPLDSKEPYTRTWRHTKTSTGLHHAPAPVSAILAMKLAVVAHLVTDALFRHQIRNQRQKTLTHLLFRHQTACACSEPTGAKNSIEPDLSI